MGLDLSTLQHALLLHIAFQRPVTTDLLLRFPLPSMHPLLHEIHTHRGLLLRTETPPQWATRPVTLLSQHDLLTLEADSTHLTIQMDDTTSHSLARLLERAIEP